eukprot:CAMPEP_0177617470 /NCGR_PEP_ID=MMETSP0419_2-20121207/24898_1 /TAXON_ID=582737 /ORGANISM="Tetraselmis sp., Strain GSL018" /LENGTH=68 /DNA_ID=CAMNT_0019115981 /DNA_START=1232 /DNA_END=1438 /DNA_ORIENTATION=+
MFWLGNLTQFQDVLKAAQIAEHFDLSRGAFGTFRRLLGFPYSRNIILFERIPPLARSRRQAQARRKRT